MEPAHPTAMPFAPAAEAEPDPIGFQELSGRLDPASVTVSRLARWPVAAALGGMALTTAAAGTAAAGAYWTLAAAAAVPILLLVGGALVVFAHFAPAWRYTHTAYRVDVHGIEIRRGRLWERTISVPRSRVQHTDVAQGPLERRYGIATLVLYTAGTEHSAVSLPGLPHGAALAIRDELLRSASPYAV